MTDTKIRFRAATGKQLIKAVDSAIKSKALKNSVISCYIGAWGEDFPHLRFKVELPNNTSAGFDIEMGNDYDDFGYYESSDGSKCRTRVVKYKTIIDIDYYDSDGQFIKAVKNDAIKDNELLNKHLKQLFNDMRIYDYEDEHGSYEETCCDFIKHKLK